MSTCPFLAEVGADVLPFVSDVARQQARGRAQQPGGSVHYLSSCSSAEL